MKQPETTYRDISPLIAADLRRGNAVRFMAQGSSMEPFLKAGDFVVVEPFNSTRKCVAPPRGTVMLYELPSGAHRLHRFTRTARGDNGSTLFRFRGDTPDHPAELIKPEQVLGTLVSCERDGRITNVDNFVSRQFGLYSSKLRNRLQHKKTNVAQRESDDTTSILTETLRETLRVEQPSPKVIPAPPRLAHTALRQGVLAICAEALISKCPDAGQDIRDLARSRAFEAENSRTFIAEAIRALSAVLPWSPDEDFKTWSSAWLETARRDFEDAKLRTDWAERPHVQTRFVFSSHLEFLGRAKPEDMAFLELRHEPYLHIGSHYGSYRRRRAADAQTGAPTLGSFAAAWQGARPSPFAAGRADMAALHGELKHLGAIVKLAGSLAGGTDAAAVVDEVEIAERVLGAMAPLGVVEFVAFAEPDGWLKLDVRTR